MSHWLYSQSFGGLGLTFGLCHHDGLKQLIVGVFMVVDNCKKLAIGSENINMHTMQVQL